MKYWIATAVTALTSVGGVLLASPASASAMPTPAAGSGPSATGVVALWHMEDTGSTMTDSSGTGNNGSLRNVTVQQPALSGNGYGFFGSSRVLVPSSPTLNPGTQPFTFTVHVRFPTAPSAQDYDLLRKGLGSTAGGDYKVEIVRGGKAGCYARGSAGRILVSGGANLADNNWHAITCAETASSVRLIVDGKTVASRSGKIGAVSNSAPLSIGSKPSGGDQYSGLMDEVSIRRG